VSDESLGVSRIGLQHLERFVPRKPWRESEGAACRVFSVMGCQLASLRAKSRLLHTGAIAYIFNPLSCFAPRLAMRGTAATSFSEELRSGVSDESLGVSRIGLQHLERFVPRKPWRESEGAACRVFSVMGCQLASLRNRSGHGPQVTVNNGWRPRLKKVAGLHKILVKPSSESIARSFPTVPRQLK
jgi:hypothetical protein